MGIPQFVLASASPARRRLLQIAGIDPIVQPSDFDESQIASADADLLVRTLALRKADMVAMQLVKAEISTPTLVLGCDSVLALHGEIYGKPDSAAEAIARWQSMRGHIGGLYTGHTLIELLPKTKTSEAHLRTLVRCQVTQVHFANISDRQIEDYVATGEPMHCAGCFALEGKGGFFVEKLEGCHSNVIGLSMPLLRQMMAELGYNVTNFW
ncbi:MAG: septum formation inhibitor Maf [Leptolyngbya sp.]|nr:MAG: septum formation inhibitor Maf [Leptolyngbya sp.]